MPDSWVGNCRKARASQNRSCEEAKIYELSTPLTHLLACLDPRGICLDSSSKARLGQNNRKFLSSASPHPNLSLWPSTFNPKRVVYPLLVRAPMGLNVEVVWAGLGVVGGFWALSCRISVRRR